MNLAIVAAILTAIGAALHQEARVGTVTESGVLVPTNQWIRPAGSRQFRFPGRALETAWLPNGNILAKLTDGLMEVKSDTAEVVQKLDSKDGSSMTGMLVSPDGGLVLFSGAGGQVLVAERDPKGKWAWTKSIELPAAKAGGAAYPLGLAWIEGNSKAVACLSRSNALAVLDVAARKTEKLIETGLCPYDVAVDAKSKIAYVASWSRRALAGEATQSSSGSPIPIRVGGSAKSGELSAIDLKAGRTLKTAPIGLQATKTILSGSRLYVATANSDEVIAMAAPSLKVVATVNLSKAASIPFGAAPNGLCLSADGNSLFVSCGGMNTAAKIDIKGFKVKGWIPTGWYPGGISNNKGTLAIAGIKGYGSRAKEDGPRTAYDWLTNISVLREPNSADLRFYTKSVLEELDAESLREPRGSGSAKPVTIPRRLGDPSVIKHVVYILKENRTYDQILGDLGKGDGDPKLCIFPRSVTPNHHALAEKYGVLDNYYCGGVLSADGHAWSTEGQVTTYFERSFGGWTRSYPFGDDPLAVSGKGFLWDGMIDKGISFRNFGEFNYAEPTTKATFKQVYDDFVSGARKIKFKHNIGVARLRKFSDLGYPGWNMGIPDVLRADRFVSEFKKMEAKGEMPQFTIIYLPQDHSSGSEAGMPTPRAHVADNDLALGRVVEALSHSRFWPKMAIFVNEDDPGGGFDHVDGHRSPCFVVSPYSAPGVNSNFYNQSSVFATMRRILGLPHLTLLDAKAPIMYECFQSRPKMGAYKSLTPAVPLDELNPPPAKTQARIDLSGPDRANERDLNTQLWAWARGAERYPAEFVGAHGRGLAAKGLKPSSSGKGVDEDEEDDD